MPKLHSSLISLFLTTLSLSAFGQTQDTTPALQQDRSALAKKWRWVYVEGKTNRVTIPEKEENFLILNIDGTYSAPSSRYKTVKGTWSYNAATKTLLTKRKKQAQYQVLYLTNNELILQAGETEKHLRYTYQAVN